MAVTMMVNRRERVRAATVQEIKDVARRQLVTEGPAAVSLRAIAREMGMTAPALYRYFPSFDHLVQALITDMYAEACTAMRSAQEQAAGQTAGKRFVTVCREFRQWAVNHPAEFGLIFGSPLPGAPAADPTRAGAAGGTDAGASQLAAIFLTSIEELWANTFPTPAPDDLQSGLVEQLASWRDHIGSSLPLGALAVAVDTWMRLLGVISLEIFNHMRFAYRDGVCNGEPYFEQQLTELASRLGVIK